MLESCVNGFSRSPSSPSPDVNEAGFVASSKLCRPTRQEHIAIDVAVTGFCEHPAIRAASGKGPDILLNLLCDKKPTSTLDSLDSRLVLTRCAMFLALTFLWPEQL